MGAIYSLTSPPKTCHFQLQQPSIDKWIYANTVNQCSNVEANWVMLAKSWTVGTGMAYS